MTATTKTQENTARAARKGFIDDAVLDGLKLPETFKAFEEAHVAPDARSKVEAATLRIFSHQRVDGAATFSLAEDLVLVTSFMSDEAAAIYIKQVLQDLRYTGKYVDRLKRISTELGVIRADCIRLGLKRTLLLELLPHPGDVRRDILKAIDAGQKMTAAQIKGWGMEEVAPRDPLITGGLGSLRSQGAARMKASVSTYGTLAGMIIAAIDHALRLQGKRKFVEKGKLIDTVQPHARHARGQLVSVACPILAKSNGDVLVGDLPKDSDWVRVIEILTTLGGSGEHWPQMAQLSGWLQDEALPTLRWSIDGNGTLEDYKTAQRVREAEALEKRASEVTQPIVAKVPAAKAATAKAAKVKAAGAKTPKDGSGEAAKAGSTTKPRKPRQAATAAVDVLASVPPLAGELTDALLGGVGLLTE